jgi:hypothetical protein
LRPDGDLVQDRLEAPGGEPRVSTWSSRPWRRAMASSQWTAMMRQAGLPRIHIRADDALRLALLHYGREALGPLSAAGSRRCSRRAVLGRRDRQLRDVAGPRASSGSRRVCNSQIFRRVVHGVGRLHRLELVVPLLPDPVGRAPRASPCGCGKNGRWSVRTPRPPLRCGAVVVPCTPCLAMTWRTGIDDPPPLLLFGQLLPAEG